MSKRLVFVWLLFGVLSIALSLLFFLPASWFALVLEKQTGGRIVLGDVQGSFWRGSAFVGGASGNAGAVTPLFPGRFSWHISPAILFGQLKVEFENSAVMATPIQVTGDWSRWRISPGSLSLPPERLEGLGAPLNTIGPSGKCRLTWNALDIASVNQQIELTGVMQLELSDMASRLSSIKPLGSYRLDFSWRGSRAELDLVSLQGPLLLSGKGNMEGGRFSFSGKAFAADGQEDKLANLLNLLGQRRKDGNKDVIALEFK
jgi:general secretion pathway protein N